MSLVTIAVVGKENVPLYLRDFTAQEESSLYSGFTDDDEDFGAQETEEMEDPFGFFESKKSKPNDSSSLKHQVRIDVLHVLHRRCTLVSLLF
jgi:hypothetical protein